MPTPHKIKTLATFLAAFLGWVLDGFDFMILTFVLIDIQRSFTVDKALAGALEASLRTSGPSETAPPKRRSKVSIQGGFVAG